jgi:hypothetical protein
MHGDFVFIFLCALAEVDIAVLSEKNRQLTQKLTVKERVLSEMRQGSRILVRYVLRNDFDLFNV